MNRSLIDQVVNAVLYEGYILYPYRASSVKNQRERFTFGRVYPEAYSLAEEGAEICELQAECLAIRENAASKIGFQVRFLQPLSREVYVLDSPVPSIPDGHLPPGHFVARLEVEGVVYQPWHEAMEREIKLDSICLDSLSFHRTTSFEFAASQTQESVRDSEGMMRGLLIRRQEAVCGRVEIAGELLDGRTWKIMARVRNVTPVSNGVLADQTAILARTFTSTHLVLNSSGAPFVSMTVPPAGLSALASKCRNIGLWPILIGNEKAGDCDTLLCSPIILSDYPKIAPESRGDLFDGTEIDEILSLRILTMTEGEKKEMRNIDGLARRVLERTEALPKDAWLKMHGTMQRDRSFDEQLFGSDGRLEGVSIADVYVKPGDRVRVRPKGRADVMDMAIAGRTAIIEAVEQDAEANIHLALVIEDDPGKDLGLLRQPGHRFFYGIDEVEPLSKEEVPL